MTQKIAFQVVNSNPKISKKKLLILCDNNKVKVFFREIITMKYYIWSYSEKYREYKHKAISFKFFFSGFFIILEVGLTTLNVIFLVIVFVLFWKLSSFFLKLVLIFLLALSKEKILPFKAYSPFF